MNRPMFVFFVCSYMLYVRTEFKPVLTHDAEKVIMSYYQLQRRSGHENAGLGLDIH